jgi:hypothetical protein
MKKTVLIACLTLTMIGCKKDKPVSIDNGVEQDQMKTKNMCIDFTDYDKLNEASERAKWLKQNGKDICPDTIDLRVRKDHEILPESFLARSNKTLQKTWKELDSMTNKFAVYEKYVSFKINPTTKEIEDVMLVDEFTNAVPCYSLALLRSIAKEHGSAITLEFINAVVGLKKTIVINVLNGNKAASYYDYSDEPKLLDGERSPL